MSDSVTPNPRTPVDYFWLFARGFAMGCADVVPGVSGGTIAFVLGIYEELVHAIKTLSDPATLKMVFTFQIQRAFRELPWPFLLAIATGILTAVFTVAQLLEWLLENQPVFLWSFFFGLVLASAWVVRSRMEHWNAATLSALIIATIGAFWIVTLVPVQTPSVWWFYFLSGAIAICAMILPGISGSFILVLLGKYQQILTAVNDRDLLTLFWVALGAGIGIVTFAQLVSFLFKRFHNVTLAALIGLMLGSVVKIWPWKQVLDSTVDSSGHTIILREINVLPAAVNAEVFIAIGLALAGFALVLVFEHLTNRKLPTSVPSHATD